MPLEEANTLVLDLSQSWSPATVKFSIIPKPSGVPILNYPSLWYHEADDALLGGFTGRSPPDTETSSAANGLSLWRLKLDGSGRNGTWTEALFPRHRAFDALTRSVGGLSAFNSTSAYVLGGYASGQDADRGVAYGTPLPGLVRYDMARSEFVNASATQYYGTGTAQRGQMLHVPVFGSGGGLFFVLGGESSPLTGYRPGHARLSFSNITVYDPATSRWYWQTTSGEAPARRINFCAAGAQSTNGTYEM
jgi:hypothetical protein